MHAEVDRHQPRMPQNLRLELLEREIEPANFVTCALEQRRWLGQGEGLPPQLVGVDENDRERSGYLDWGRCA
jgi:hypothetical protein